MNRVCVRAKRGIGTSCVCDKYEDAETAFRVYGVVHSRDPRLKPRHPGVSDEKRRSLRTFKDLCRASGVRKFTVGSTPVAFAPVGPKEEPMSYSDLPSMEDYSGGEFGLDIVSRAKAMLPSKEAVINMVKAGGGVLGARLVSTQIVPRIPWLGDKFKSNIWVRVVTKLALGLVAGKTLTRFDGYFGAGAAAGFAGDAISDLVDHFLFKGSMSVAQATQAAEAGASAAQAATSGMGMGQGDDELFLGQSRSDMPESKLFGAGPDAERAANSLFGVEDRMFAMLDDVDVMEPDSLGSLGEIDVMTQQGPIGATHGGDAGSWQGIDGANGVGTWIG